MTVSLRVCDQCGIPIRGIREILTQEGHIATAAAAETASWQRVTSAIGSQRKTGLNAKRLIAIERWQNILRVRVSQCEHGFIDHSHRELALNRLTGIISHRHIEGDFIARSRLNRIRNHLLDLQAEVQLIGDVRGLGAMMLMELVRDRDTKVPAPDETLLLTQECLKRGLIAIRSGLFSNCIRFLPPLNITDEQVDEAMSIIAEALRVVETQRREAVKA